MNHPFPNTRNERLAGSDQARSAHSRLRKKGLLGSGIFMLGKPKKAKEAKPPKKLEPTTAMPTPERQAKAHYGWQEESHPGGQVSYQEVSSLAALKPQLSEQEMKLLVMIADDFRAAESIKVSSRPYTGATYAAAIRSEE